MNKLCWSVAPAVLLLAGCMTTSTRNLAFTDDWADHLRVRGMQDRRMPAPGQEQQEGGTVCPGPAAVVRGESGKWGWDLGGGAGLGVHVHPPRGNIRHRFEWGVLRPRCRR